MTRQTDLPNSGKPEGLTRRDFLQRSALAAGALAIPDDQRSWQIASGLTANTPSRLAAEVVHVADALPIIPYPLEAARSGGEMELRRNSEIRVGSSDLRPLAELLQRTIARSTGFPLSITDRGSAAATTISLRRITPADAALGVEGYRLQVTPRATRIEANDSRGVFYGIQTLLQLMPAEIESSVRVERSWPIPCVQIVDRPRFGWRGLMLDVAHHFYDAAYMKRYIDQMARYKLNVLHLHVVDNQGWRLEIKSVPQLHEIGGWRDPNLPRGRRVPQSPRSPGATNRPPDGGYYTHDDIRELVAYGAMRGVTILPEIDVPGHSFALLTVFPELACKGKPAGDVCPGNEQLYDVLDKVIQEVSTLFPGEFIHMGGDEAGRSAWRDCSKCQARMQAEGLKSVEELQGYFMRRVGRLVQARGKRMMGWDEILEGGSQDPSTAVMHYSIHRRTSAIRAAQRKHSVLMAPETHTYFDWGQGDPAIEPMHLGSKLRLLSQVYRFEPVPPGVDPTLILGGEGCLWTGGQRHPREVEYMTWPRGLALAEACWSSAARRPWEDFVGRIEQHFPRFAAAEVNVARSVYQPLAELRTGGGDSTSRSDWRIVLRKELADIELYYSFDGGNPDPFYPRYVEPLAIPPGAEKLRVAPYRGGRLVGTQLVVTIDELEKRRPFRDGYEHDWGA